MNRLFYWLIGAPVAFIESMFKLAERRYYRLSKSIDRYFCRWLGHEWHSGVFRVHCRFCYEDRQDQP